MNNNLGALADWDEVQGDVFLPGVPATLHEHRFEFLAESDVSCFVFDELSQGDGEGQLVAAGPAGRQRVRFVAVGGVVVRFNCHAGRVFLRRAMRQPQIIRDKEIPSFTQIEPRASGPGAELRRMMLMVQLNNQRREAALAGEIKRLSEGLAAVSAVSPSAAGKRSSASKKLDDVVQDENAEGIDE